MLLCVGTGKVRRGIVGLFLVLSGVSSALGYWATSTGLESEPPARTFDGWIGVFQPERDVASGVQVKLSAYALSDRETEKPRMAYSATACGAGPFSGYLLIGGDARLDNVTIQAPPDDARVLPAGDLEVADEGDGSVTTYQDVQVVRVSLQDLPRCLGSGADDSFSGVGFRIEGNAAGPVTTSSGGLLPGAVQRWSMPYIGNFPGAGGRAGVFRFKGAIHGEFVRPIPLAAAVDAGPVPLRLELSDSRPPTDSVDRASWYLPQPFQGTVKVRDSSYQSTLQRWNTFSAIALGVFGSIVAAMLFEWTRSRAQSPSANLGLTPAESIPGSDPVQLVASRPQRPRSAPTLGAWVPIAVVGYLLSRLSRRRGRSS